MSKRGHGKNLQFAKIGHSDDGSSKMMEALQSALGKSDVVHNQSTVAMSNWWAD